MNIGRVTNAFASAHDRSRVHCARVYPNEARRLVVSFNGLMPKGELIVSAVFRQVAACSVAMADAQIADDQRSVSLKVTAAYRGSTTIKTQVTTDQGNTYNLLTMVEVLSGPWFGDENTAAGPTELSVSV